MSTTAFGHHSNGKTPNGQTKKLVIKPLKLKPQLPADFEDVTWAKLRDAVYAVHHKQPVSCSLEELYAAVENMCIHKMADKLYNNLQKECDAHIEQQVIALSKKISLESQAFLERLNTMWLDYCSQMLTIRSIFLYLDRTYVISTVGVRSLFDMGLQLLRKHLLDHREAETYAVAGLLRLIERERAGEAVDRGLLQSLVRLLVNLGLYADDFQPQFLEQTRVFYQAEGQRLLADLNVPDYLLHCEKRLSEEYERCAEYLDASTRKSLVGVVEAQLVSSHVAAVLDKGFAALMDAQRVPDLARLHALCVRVNATEVLRTAFKDYVCNTGHAIVRDEEKDKDMVERLLEFKGRVDEVMSSSFARSDAFAAALKEAFERFINVRQNKPAELIAKFVDAKLRSSKGMSDEEVESMLDKSLILFRFISGKDVFEAFYKKDLAKRLLMGKSASIDSEKSMISKLKAECGQHFTSKLEGMFTDIDVSKDALAGFKRSSYATGRLPAGLDVNIHVLTQVHWPTYPVMDAKLPAEAGVCQDAFSEYYRAKHSGRNLVWHNSLGTCLLKARFPKGDKELSVSLFQAVVLMLFNEVDSLSLEEIRAQSGVDDRELRRTLQSLACGKVRVLLKEPKGRDVCDGDVFHYNAGFQDRLVRIKVNTIQMKETAEENAKTNEEVMQDRQQTIDAAIVRIMKTRKQLSHRLLVQEVLQQLKFVVRAADLKKRIESLIDREYLQRDPGDSQLYKYLA